MPRKTKLSTYYDNTGMSGPSALQSAPRGTFNSRTMIVMRIAITPSLKASRRPLLITCSTARTHLDAPWNPGTVRRMKPTKHAIPSVIGGGENRAGSLLEEEQHRALVDRGRPHGAGK